MSEERVLLDGNKVREWRLRRNYSQQGLATTVGISVRMIGMIERMEAPVPRCYAEWVAGALRVTLEAIKLPVPHLETVLAWLPLPPGLKRLQNRLALPLQLDMLGRHRAAIRECHKALGALRKSDRAGQALVRLMQAVFADNAGWHGRALALLDQIDQEVLPEEVAEEIRLRVRYHRAIARRRLGQWDKAERELRLLSKQDRQRKMRVGIKYQQGVVFLEREDQPKRRRLQKALARFQFARNHYRKTANHREGFALRRMGQAYAQSRRPAQAGECYLEAAIVFARSQCQRYLIETRREFTRLIRLVTSAAT
jgi:transcriptional regulator with XRE-family HTH domain